MTTKQTTAPIDASTKKGEAEQLSAAIDEKKALAAWEKNGKKGKRPSTANLDAVNNAEPKSTRAKSSGTRGRTKLSGDAELRFVVDGRPIIDRHNRLAGVSRATGFKGGKKLSTDELRVWLSKHGAKNPDSEAFKVTLPNGVVLEARKDTPALKKQANEPKPRGRMASDKPAAKKSAAKKAAPAKTSTAKKSAAKRTTTKAAAKKAA